MQAPSATNIRRGDLTAGFLRYEFGGLIFRGANTSYAWRGLFSEFYGTFYSRANMTDVSSDSCNGTRGLNWLKMAGKNKTSSVIIIMCKVSTSTDRPS